jgi:hypothetical protein
MITAILFQDTHKNKLSKANNKLSKATGTLREIQEPFKVSLG